MMIAKKGKAMTVSFKNFEKWAKRRFGNENVLVQGKEIRIHSIYLLICKMQNKTMKWIRHNG
jgi:hypothetical protein